MDLSGSAPSDVTSALPKFSRYKSVKRATVSPSVNVSNGVTPTSSAGSASLDGTSSRYRRGRTVGSVPANAPPLPHLIRSSTANDAIPQLHSKEESPLELNKAQQEAFDILTGKIDRSQQKLKKQVEQEKKSREALAEQARAKQAEQQAKAEMQKKEVEKRIKEEQRAKIQRLEQEGKRAREEREALIRKLEEQRAEEIKLAERHAAAERAAQREANQVQKVSPGPDAVRQGARRPSEAAQQAEAKASLSYESLRRAPPSPRISPPEQRGRSNTMRERPRKQSTEQEGDPFPDIAGKDTSRKLVKRQAPTKSKSADPTSHEAISSHQYSDAPEVPNNPPGPNFDAPKSAVNAGVRKVKVRYGPKSMQLDVTPTSTPIDLLTSAKDLLEYGFDPQRYVLQEGFKQIELERPLRHYERVRDVMNSWNSDEQHCFNIVSAVTEWDSASLKYGNAPREQPEETTVVVYHSQRPRVWDKRIVTLRSDGQVVVQKHEGATPTNMCHMSDFDVFMPTRREMKVLKAPRKFCFAIKSLQKPAAFLNTANFVHFISTKDQDLAMQWYKAVHGWRSWYMVHSLGLGQDGSKASNDEPKEPLIPDMPRGRNVSTTSASNKPPQLPTLGLDERLLPESTFVTSPSFMPTSPKTPHNTRGPRGPPPSAFVQHTLVPSSSPEHGLPPPSSRVRARSTSRTRSSSVSRDPRPPSFNAEPFSSSGLLGRTYTLRRQALDSSDDNTPPVPDLPPGQKPLVDLTPERAAAPQFSRRGRGVTLDTVPTGGLVSAATSADPAFANSSAITAVPPPPIFDALTIAANGATSTGASGTAGSNGIGGLARSTSRRTRTLKSADQQAYADAFTGSGLLAKAGDRGQGDRRVGKGVASGDRNATEPMISVDTGMKWGKGSLLEGVQMRDGDGGPVIDRAWERNREREREVRVGEGF